LPPAAPLSGEDDSNELAIRSLEDKVRADPRDYIGHNKLAGYYLARQRETGDTAYLDLAARAARASLDAAPVEVNPGGLAALAHAEFSLHNFGAAREHAMRLVELAPRKSYPYRILGDALIELGDYDGATEAFAKMERLEQFPTAASETRLARLAFLRGETDAAQRRLTRAVALALEETPVSRETVAWCRWQLGEMAFSVGDYETAERHDRDALTTFPNYYRALASLGRARAARGDLAGAIEQYEQAVRVLPDPTFIATLGDLYQLAGRDKEAAAQHELVEKIAGLGAAKGALYDRQLALFYADHDIKAEQAYAIAAKEYAARPDIYGADALAWTALKAGKLDEAREKIKEALRLGSRDARLFYHAGMIARAAGDVGAAREQLRRALELSPQFDPLQSVTARKVLAELSS
jgi:tetratricopeptide (TPR) repeat protein